MGSLHCVAVTDQGDVYTWGDNDEGQLGDGTTNAIQKPKQVASLKGRKMNRVACGSAHTVAWSTSKVPHRSVAQLPSQVPMEYDHLKGIAMPVLRNRYCLLYLFNEMFGPCITFLDLGPASMFKSLKGLLMLTGKETAFRKIIQNTMVRDRQHGPVVELNRMSNSPSRKTVFAQMVSKMSLLTPECLLLPHRIWKVKLVGESVDDCGGGYSESIAEMCEELQKVRPHCLPLGMADCIDQYFVT